MLGFFFRHYDPIVDRYIVHDDGSTDGTIDILKAHPRVELRQFKRIFPGKFTSSNQKLENSVWKESRGRADWVILVDTDEHIFVPGVPLRDYLDRSRDQGITLMPSLGYQMISEEYPGVDEHLCYTRTMGAPFSSMSKLCVFNPEAISDSNYTTGRHRANPVGCLRYPKKDELLLLHYKNLNFDRTWARQSALSQKYSALIKPGQTLTYTWSQDQYRNVWDGFSKASRDVSNPDLKPWKSHLEIRWWRQDWRFRLYRKFARIRRRWARSLNIS